MYIFRDIQELYAPPPIRLVAARTPIRSSFFRSTWNVFVVSKIFASKERQTLPRTSSGLIDPKNIGRALEAKNLFQVFEPKNVFQGRE